LTNHVCGSLDENTYICLCICRQFSNYSACQSKWLY